MEEGDKGETECPQDDEAATSAFDEHGEGQELPFECPEEVAGVAGSAWHCCANTSELLSACRAARAVVTMTLAALEAARRKVHSSLRRCCMQNEWRSSDRRQRSTQR
jgi:hypothetical protein